MKPPSRPWPIDPKYRRSRITSTVGSVVFGIAAIVVSFMAFWRQARGISQEQRIWDTGLEPRAWRIKVDQKPNRSVFHSYILTVDWIDGKGKQHTNRQEYSTAFKQIELPRTPVALPAPVDEGVAVEDWGKPVAKKAAEPSPVRYDSEDFTRVAWQPAIEGASGRWISTSGILILGLVIAVLFFLYARNQWKLYPVIFRGSLTGKPVPVRLLKVRTLKHKFRITGQEYTLEHPVTGKNFTEIISEGKKPMFLEGGSHLQGVLIEGSKHPVMLLEDGYPYVFKTKSAVWAGTLPK